MLREFQEIEDANQDAILPTLIGLTIVSIERDKHSGDPFGHGDNSVRIGLSDGRILDFTGFGYDASRLVTTVSHNTPINQVFEARDRYIKEHGILPTKLRCRREFMTRALMSSLPSCAWEIDKRYLENSSAYAAGVYWEVDDSIPAAVGFVLSH